MPISWRGGSSWSSGEGERAWGIWPVRGEGWREGGGEGWREGGKGWREEGRVRRRKFCVPKERCKARCIVGNRYRVHRPQLPGLPGLGVKQSGQSRPPPDHQTTCTG